MPATRNAYSYWWNPRFPDPDPDVISDDATMRKEQADTPPKRVDLSEVNIGQVSPIIIARIIALLVEYWDKNVFALDPKNVAACKGPPMELPLINEDCIPYAAKQCRWSPAETRMILAEIDKFAKAGMIRRSASPWAVDLVMVLKKDGMAKMCQDFRVLNSRLLANSGGLGDAIIHSVMGNCGCTTSIDLDSGFHQIPLAEKHKFKTAFRDAHGELWELNPCSFGLKTLPAAFAARVARRSEL